MEDIINNLQTLDLNKSKQLGDYFRDEDNRSSYLVKSNLSKLLLTFNYHLTLVNEEDLVMETLRVVINLLAFNDYNRKFITDDTSVDVRQFWSTIVELLHMDTYQPRIFALLNQFLYDTEYKLEFINFFKHQGVKNHLYKVVNRDNVNGISEFLFEISSSISVRDELDQNFLQSCIEYISDEEDSYVIELIDLNQPSDEIFTSVLMKLSDPHTTLIKRKLFAICPNLANYDLDSKSLSLCMEKSTQKDIDPYVFFTSSITMGNYITNETTKTQISQKLSGVINLVIENYFSYTISDVIQMQSVHLWINLMNPTIANEISTKFSTKLINLTELICNNEKFYREIFILFIKFLKKINQYSILPSEIFDILANYEGNEVLELKYACLQSGKYINNSKVLDDLILNVTKLNKFNILEQLKTLVIFNDSQYAKDNQRELIQSYYSPLNHLLLELCPQLDIIDNNDWQQKAFKNNLKFLAVATLKNINEESKLELTDLITSCESIINQDLNNINQDPTVT